MGNFDIRGLLYRPLSPVRAKFRALEQTHDIRLLAKFRLERFILSPSGGENPHFLPVFGRPFVKRFALCYRSVFLSALSVTFVRCDQMVGRIKMKLGTQVGLGPGHIVLGGDPAPPPLNGHSPQVSAHICCAQMAAWIRMSLGMEVGLGPGDFVLDGVRSRSPLPKRGTEPPPNFRPMFIAVKRLDG